MASTDKPRLLARTAGYTSAPHLAIDHAEAIPEAEQERLSGEGRRRDAEREAKRRELVRRLYAHVAREAEIAHTLLKAARLDPTIGNRARRVGRDLGRLVDELGPVPSRKLFE
jgi:hypothetical protein